MNKTCSECDCPLIEQSEIDYNSGGNKYLETWYEHPENECRLSGKTLWENDLVRLREMK